MGVTYVNGMENILNDTWHESTASDDGPKNSLLM